MFCTKCGSQLPDNAAFCTNCGAPLRSSQTTGVQNFGASDTSTQVSPTQDSNTPNMQSQVFGGQNSAGQNFVSPNIPGPIMSSMNMPRRKSNTGLVVGVAVAGVLALLLLVFLGVKVLSGGTNSSPENVVKTFFKAISKEDVTMLKSTFSPKNSELISQMSMFLNNETLGTLNDELVKEFGNNWYNKLSVKQKDKTTKSGKTYISVEVMIDNNKDNSETMTVVKEGSKYYLSDFPF